MADAFDDPVEIDETTSVADGGPARPRRSRQCGRLRHPPQGGKDFALMIADCGQAILVPIIRRKVAPASVVYSDSWGGYDTPVD